jgi:hypothetical protein
MRGVQIYRPNTDLAKGWAIQFNLGFDRRENVVVFIEAARQVGPKPAPGSTTSPFDWENKIRFMLNANELGELGACIRGIHRKKIKFIHQTGEGDKQKLGSFTLEFPETDEAKKYGNWRAEVFARQGGTDKRIQAFITPAELYQILMLIDFSFMKNFAQGPRKRPQVAEEATTPES